MRSNGWIKVTSDQELAGLNFLGDFEGTTTDYYLADVPFTKNISKLLLIPHVAQNTTWDTIVYIANPNDSSATVTLTYTNKSGSDSTPVVVTISANGSAEIPTSIIGNSTSIQGGYVTISSTQGVTAFALYNNLKTGNYSNAGINAVNKSIIVEIHNYYLPVFKPKPGHWSGLGITNLRSTSTASVHITIYNQSGSILATETKAIPAKGQDAFVVGASLSSDGWIKIVSDEPLAGLNFLGDYEGVSTDYYLADVPFTETLSKLLLIPHVAQNDTWDTNILIANPNTSSATVTFTYTNKAGTDSTPVVVTISANGSAEIPTSIIGNSTSIQGGYVTISSTQGVTAFALYNNLKTGNYSNAGINAVDVSVDCGAYVAPGVWKEFDCYNLAALGKTTDDDPFTPSWRLIGGYWHWGRKGPDASQWYDTNTDNFAHGPTGPESGDANDGDISSWDDSYSYAPDGSWSDVSKTVNDPCPFGYRVPTESQWNGVINNNTQSSVGNWNSDETNYNSALFFGNDLMLPASGGRHVRNGSLSNRGTSGDYWSSTQITKGGACNLSFGSSEAYMLYYSRRQGFSVRCVVESEFSACTYSISSSSGNFTKDSGGKSVTVTASSSSCSWITSNSLSWVTLSPTSGTDSTNVTVSVTANTGLARSGSVTIAGNIYAISQASGSQTGNCGAYVAPGVWKEFDCYNLAALGKTTDDDPFTPSWRLIGGYWQWGRKGPDSSQWYDTNTENFAHGPTGPGSIDANEGEINVWEDDNDAPDGSWSDTSKTTNDPCPVGYRVPTESQWDGVLDNNTHIGVGTWDSDDTNYNSALFFGNDLMLPASGSRYYSSGSLSKRGYLGAYWSSTQSKSNLAGALNFYSSNPSTGHRYRRSGYSVRCVVDDNNLRTVILTSPKDSSSIDECSYSFVRNAMESNPNLETYDILLESWCVDNSPFCGNFADIGVVDIATVNSYPSSGYISDCTDDWDTSHSFISKNRDGSHTVFKIIKHFKLSNCQHVVEISYRNLD